MARAKTLTSNYTFLTRARKFLSAVGVGAKSRTWIGSGENIE